MKHAVHEHKLPSGACGLVVDVPGSAVVNVRVNFRSGFQFSDPRVYEVPHIMEHMLATVTKRHTEPNSFMIDAQKNGAYVNASTSAETNDYIYEFANFELDRILDLIEEQVSEPYFAVDSFVAEKSNVREELTRNTTQHMSVCAIKLSEQTFPKQWKGYEERISQLENIKLEQLENHYHLTHTARNARFYVSGHFPDGGRVVADRFEKIFARLPRGERLKLSQELGKKVESPIVTVRDIEQIYYRTGMFFHEIDHQQQAALALLRMLMVGGMGSRVLGEARRRGLAYSVGAIAYSEPGNSSFGFTGYVTPEHAESLYEVINRSLRAVGAGEVSTDELEAAKNLLVGSITRSTQTAGDVLQWYIERYDESDEIRDFEVELGRLRTVSSDDVTNVSRLILGTDQTALSLLGRIQGVEAQTYASLLSFA
jgi:predicted Zn-dependent peptidase